jgi:hypothetical protein
LLCALVGCGGGGGAKGRDAAAGNGGGGAGGSAGSSVSAGAGGSVGTGTAGAGGDGSGLPACAITARPQDGGGTDAGSACSSIVLDGPWINRGCFDRMGDGGVADGGSFDGPAGGAIRDGDYDLVSADTSLSGGPCPADYSGGMTRRRIRVFGGGTYIEWAYTNRDSSGTDTSVWYDTTVQAAGQTLTFVSFDCGESFGVTSYGYTASGDLFTYFGYSGSAAGAGDLQSVVRYRRTCWR